MISSYKDPKIWETDEIKQMANSLKKILEGSGKDEDP